MTTQLERMQQLKVRAWSYPNGRVTEILYKRANASLLRRRVWGSLYRVSTPERDLHLLVGVADSDELLDTYQLHGDRYELPEQDAQAFKQRRVLFEVMQKAAGGPELAVESKYPDGVILDPKTGQARPA
jgi:hypothetical protein